MPSSILENAMLQITEAANEDKRDQPWKESVERIVNNPVTDDKEEIVKTGGKCDVLKMFFPAC